MQYMGSKNRLSKELLPIILKHRKENQVYVEPFCGGCNMIDKIDGKRLANDYNEYLIELWRALQNGWIPPTTVTKQEYDDIRLNKDKYSKHLVCFVGLLCAFGGKWFGGYAKNSKGDNYADRGSRVIVKQIQLLKGVGFINGSYDAFTIPNNSLIYCDPPYANTTKYKDDFDHDNFWEWCREKAREGHTIFISEYNAPADFECIFEKEVKTVLNKNSQDAKRVERLFVPRTNGNSEMSWVTTQSKADMNKP